MTRFLLLLATNQNQLPNVTLTVYSTVFLQVQLQTFTVMQKHIITKFLHN